MRKDFAWAHSRSFFGLKYIVKYLPQSGDSPSPMPLRTGRPSLASINFSSTQIPELLPQQNSFNGDGMDLRPDRRVGESVSVASGGLMTGRSALGKFC